MRLENSSRVNSTLIRFGFVTTLLIASTLEPVHAREVVAFGTPAAGSTVAVKTPHTGLTLRRGWEAAVEEFDPYIEHESDVWIGKVPYRFLKLNLGKQRFKEVAVGPHGQEVDPQWVIAERRRHFGRFGRIHPTLHAALAESAHQYFDVTIWLDIEPPTGIHKPRKIPRGDEEETLKRLGRAYEKVLTRFRARRDERIVELNLAGEVDRDAMNDTPFVRAPKLYRDRIQELSKSSLVKMLLQHDSEGREDLASSMAIANADDVQAAGITGNGVKVAVFERSPADTSNLNVVDSYSASAGFVPSLSNHAQNVSAIINNSNAVSGFAPDTSFYSADSTAIAALDWAVDTIRVSALNQSFHRSAEIGDGLQADDLYKDFKVLQYPWPTIVHAAGNWCPPGSSCFEGGSDVTDEFVNHKGYNTISIGNHNDTATQMSASSCFINPTSSHNDRELPELSANGTGVTADGITMSGTSMASPAVTGSVALLQDRDSTLRIWPEGVRALLFAGATRNVDTHAGTLSGGGAAANAPNTWWTDLSLGNDAFDGAGALNIERSDLITQNRWSGAPAARGWDIGRMTDARFDGRFFEREYQVKAGGSFWFVPHVKVALAWNGTSTVSGSEASQVYASEIDMDLDLRVYDSSGAQVAYSLSWDNSYEIVDFDAKAGETYTIKVHRWSGNPGSWTWFGIAWDTTYRPGSGIFGFETRGRAETLQVFQRQD